METPKEKNREVRGKRWSKKETHIFIFQTYCIMHRGLYSLLKLDQSDRVVGYSTAELSQAKKMLTEFDQFFS